MLYIIPRRHGIREEIIYLFKESYKSKKRIGCWLYVSLTLHFLLLLPFILEGAGLLLVLSPLCLLGFALGLIKEKNPYIWVFIATFINLGGLMDIVSDIGLLVRVIFDYLWDDEDKQRLFEDDVLIARVCITLIGGLGGILWMAFTSNVLPEIRKVIEPNKTHPKPKKLRLFMPIQFLVLMVGWKIFVGLSRVRICKAIARAMRQHKRIDEDTELAVQWEESFVLLDVLWSSIPLGVLTALDMFYLKETPLDTENILELIKLIALAIDLVGVAHLVYFEILQLGCGHHSHHHHHDMKDAHNKPLLSKA